MHLKYAVARIRLADMHYICSEYAAVIERYAETRMAGSQGRVCHALAGALRALLHHWHCRVAQLEHAALCSAPPLTLQVRR